MIDLSKHLKGICRALDVDPKLVLRVEIRPDAAEVTLCKTDGNGKPYVDPETGEAALVQRLFEVKT